jgi:GcrA cell cycle regulator
VAQLKAMWLAGMSSGEIASSLGGVSRNAVMGKIHRLKLVRTDPSVLSPLQRAAGKAVR